MIYQMRPSRQDLIRQNYLYDSTLSLSLTVTQRDLMRKRQIDAINRALKQRPSLQQLMNRNIIRTDGDTNILHNDSGDHQSKIASSETLSELLSSRQAIDQVSVMMRDASHWIDIHVPPTTRTTISASLSIHDDNLDASVVDTNHVPRDVNNPTDRSYFGLSTYGNNVYLTGGNIGPPPLMLSICIFNSSSYKWMNVTMCDAPYNISGHVCVSVEDRGLYIIGGYIPSEGTYNTHVIQLQIATETSDSVSIIPHYVYPLDNINTAASVSPAPRAGHTAISLTSDTKPHTIFMFGGNNNEYYFNDTWMFDTNTHMWMEAITNGCVPCGRSGHTMNAVERHIFIFGGRGCNTLPFNDMYILDSVSLVWFRPTFNGSPPSSRSNHTCVVVNNSLLVFGGVSEGGTSLNDLHIFDTGINTYTNNM